MNEIPDDPTTRGKERFAVLFCCPQTRDDVGIVPYNRQIKIYPQGTACVPFRFNIALNCGTPHMVFLRSGSVNRRGDHWSPAIVGGDAHIAPQSAILQKILDKIANMVYYIDNRKG